MLLRVKACETLFHYPVFHIERQTHMITRLIRTANEYDCKPNPTEKMVLKSNIPAYLNTFYTSQNALSDFLKISASKQARFHVYIATD